MSPVSRANSSANIPFAQPLEAPFAEVLAQYEPVFALSQQRSSAAPVPQKSASAAGAATPALKLGLSPEQMKWLWGKLANSTTVKDDLEDLAAISNAKDCMDDAAFDAWLLKPENKRAAGTYFRYVVQAPPAPLDGIQTWFYSDESHQKPAAVAAQLAVLGNDQKQELLDLAFTRFDFKNIKTLVGLIQKQGDPALRRVIADKLLHMAVAPQSFRDGPHLACAYALQFSRAMDGDAKGLGAMLAKLSGHDAKRFALALGSQEERIGDTTFFSDQSQIKALAGARISVLAAVKTLSSAEADTPAVKALVDGIWAATSPDDFKNAPGLVKNLFSSKESQEFVEVLSNNNSFIRGLDDGARIALMSQARNYPDPRSIKNLGLLAVTPWFRAASLEDQQRSAKMVAFASQYDGGDTELLNRTLRAFLGPRGRTVEWRLFEDRGGERNGSGIRLNSAYVSAGNGPLTGYKAIYIATGVLAHELNHTLNGDEVQASYRYFMGEYRARYVGYEAELVLLVSKRVLPMPSFS